MSFAAALVGSFVRGRTKCKKLTGDLSNETNHEKNYFRSGIDSYFRVELGHGAERQH